MSSSTKSISFPCVKMAQPIGEFYIGVIDSKILCEIAYADIRRVEKEEKREILSYLGIQRPLNPKRVEEIKNYVRTVDACFPTSVILAVDGECARYNDRKKELVLKPTKKIVTSNIAKILDGQHRLAGLRNYKGKKFEINVSVFIDIDLAVQGHIFATVNLAQTKVNKSLAYDLYDLETTRSPEKTCHLISVALDEHKKSAL